MFVLFLCFPVLLFVKWRELSTKLNVSTQHKYECDTEDRVDKI